MITLESAKNIKSAKLKFDIESDKINEEYSRKMVDLENRYLTKIKDLILPPIIEAAEHDFPDIENNIVIKFNGFYKPPKIFANVYFVNQFIGCENIILQCIMDELNNVQMTYDIIVDGECVKQRIYNRRSAITIFMKFILERKNDLFGFDSRKYFAEIRHKYDELCNSRTRYADIMIERLHTYLITCGFHDDEFSVYWNPELNELGNLTIFVKFNEIPDVEIKYSCVLTKWLIGDSVHMYNDAQIIDEIRRRLGCIEEKHITIQI